MSSRRQEWVIEPLAGSNLYSIRWDRVINQNVSIVLTGQNSKHLAKGLTGYYSSPASGDGFANHGDRNVSSRRQECVITETGRCHHGDRNAAGSALCQNLPFPI